MVGYRTGGCEQGGRGFEGVGGRFAREGFVSRWSFGSSSIKHPVWTGPMGRCRCIPGCDVWCLCAHVCKLLFNCVFQDVQSRSWTSYCTIQKMCGAASPVLARTAAAYTLVHQSSAPQRQDPSCRRTSRLHPGQARAGLIPTSLTNWAYAYAWGLALYMSLPSHTHTRTMYKKDGS